MNFNKKIIKKSVGPTHFLRTVFPPLSKGESWVVYRLFANPTDTWRPAIIFLLIKFFYQTKKIQKPTYKTVHGLMVILGISCLLAKCFEIVS